MIRGLQTTVHAIDAVTATTTSQAIDIRNARKITLLVKRSNHSSGSTAFTVTVSIDGTNFYAYNKLIRNVANTNAQNLTRDTTITLSSNTQEFVSFSPEDCFKFMKVVATETTDGTHDAWVTIQY